MLDESKMEEGATKLVPASPPGPSASPLVAAVAALSAQVLRADELGDLVTARVLQSALAGLLASPSTPGEIVALDVVRTKRGGS